ncbi:hypothetical protein FRAAL1049 [Frankia alni ACN14a]|uniref:Uncharacterized protein n=1 Tax=Frankia alni (strain DSM 45986 / CECT 9034 / ACN14a) TaxID=326424 RepID=Q0RRV1_FRAAA|nr:hypothetical protein FRAAL1049 [Frankia alni ACN14a]
MRGRMVRGRNGVVGPLRSPFRRMVVLHRDESWPPWPSGRRPGGHAWAGQAGPFAPKLARQPAAAGGTAGW